VGREDRDLESREDREQGGQDLESGRGQRDRESWEDIESWEDRES
jgi:hypothetical protein